MEKLEGVWAEKVAKSGHQWPSSVRRLLREEIDNKKQQVRSEWVKAFAGMSDPGLPPERFETEVEIRLSDPDAMAEFDDRMRTFEIPSGEQEWIRQLGELITARRLERLEQAVGGEDQERQGAESPDDRRSAEVPDLRAAGSEEDYQDHIDGEKHWYFEDGLEEARALQMFRPCVPPSEAEVRAHRASGHANFRSWCSACVRGVANDRRHVLRLELPPGAAPEVHSDYGFFRNCRVDKSSVPVFVSTVRGHQCLGAHVVPRKGIGSGWIVQQHLRDLRKWGIRGKVIFRSDQEPAIIDLLDKVASLRTSPTLLEQSPKADSKANGRAERAVQKLQKKVRVLKIALEESIGLKLDVGHPVFAWLVEHAADVITKSEVGADGKTAWERLKTRPYGGSMLEFGCSVLVRIAQQPVGGDMSERWIEGTWLGKRFSSDEHVVALTSGLVVRSGTVRLHPEKAYDAEKLLAVVGTPWDPSAKGAAVNVDQERPAAGDVPHAPAEAAPGAVPIEVSMPQVRRLMITSPIIGKVGFSENCVKCRLVKEGDLSTPWAKHSEACRTRVEAAVRADPELARLVQQADQRREGFVERRVLERGRRAESSQAVGDRGGVGAPAPSIATSSLPSASAASSFVAAAPGLSEEPGSVPGLAEPEPKRRRQDESERIPEERATREVGDEIPVPTVDHHPDDGGETSAKRARLDDEGGVDELLEPREDEVGFVGGYGCSRPAGADLFERGGGGWAGLTEAEFPEFESDDEYSSDSVDHYRAELERERSSARRGEVLEVDHSRPASRCSDVPVVERGALANWRARRPSSGVLTVDQPKADVQNLLASARARFPLPGGCSISTAAPSVVEFCPWRSSQAWQLGADDGCRAEEQEHKAPKGQRPNPKPSPASR